MVDVVASSRSQAPNTSQSKEGQMADFTNKAITGWEKENQLVAGKKTPDGKNELDIFKQFANEKDPAKAIADMKAAGMDENDAKGMLQAKNNLEFSQNANKQVMNGSDKDSATYKQAEADLKVTAAAETTVGKEGKEIQETGKSGTRCATVGTVVSPDQEKPLGKQPQASQPEDKSQQLKDIQKFREEKIPGATDKINTDQQKLADEMEAFVNKDQHTPEEIKKFQEDKQNFSKEVQALKSSP